MNTGTNMAFVKIMFDLAVHIFNYHYQLLISKFKMSLFRLELYWQENCFFYREKCRLGLLRYCAENVGIKLPF